MTPAAATAAGRGLGRDERDDQNRARGRDAEHAGPSGGGGRRELHRRAHADARDGDRGGVGGAHDQSAQLGEQPEARRPCERPTCPARQLVPVPACVQHGHHGQAERAGRGAVGQRPHHGRGRRSLRICQRPCRGRGAENDEYTPDRDAGCAHVLRRAVHRIPPPMITAPATRKGHTGIPPPPAGVGRFCGGRTRCAGRGDREPKRPRTRYRVAVRRRHPVVHRVGARWAERANAHRQHSALHLRIAARPQVPVGPDDGHRGELGLHLLVERCADALRTSGQRRVLGGVVRDASRVRGGDGSTGQRHRGDKGSAPTSASRSDRIMCASWRSTPRPRRPPPA